MLADLANRRLSYDENTTRLRRIIAEDGGQPEPQALCELLEIPREKWQNAVEGYLNTRRFDLIVRPEDFWPPAARQGAQRYLSERRRHGNAEIARRFDANRKTNVSHLDNLRERLRQERSNYNRDYQFGGAIDAPDNAAYEAEQSKLAETATVRDYEVHILNRLLDRYERSAHFRRTPEEQASARGVFLPFDRRTFREYWIEEDPAYRREINGAARTLAAQGLVQIYWARLGRDTEIAKVGLNLQRLDDAYRIAGRRPRRDKEAALRQLAERWLERWAAASSVLAGLADTGSAAAYGATDPSDSDLSGAPRIWGQALLRAVLDGLQQHRTLPLDLDLDRPQDLDALCRVLDALTVLDAEEPRRPGICAGRAGPGRCRSGSGIVGTHCQSAAPAGGRASGTTPQGGAPGPCGIPVGPGVARGGGAGGGSGGRERRGRAHRGEPDQLPRTRRPAGPVRHGAVDAPALPGGVSQPGAPPIAGQAVAVDPAGGKVRPLLPLGRPGSGRPFATSWRRC